MFKELAFIAAATAAAPALAASDPRGDDAVAAFGDLCVGLFTAKQEAELDAARFSFTKIAEETARRIKPDVEGPLWDVSGVDSGVHMLVHYEPTGICVVEVAEADEESIRAAFERLVERTSTALGSPAQRQPDKRNRVDGKDATTSMWRISSSKGDVMLAETTYPVAKFAIQHLMTVSYVR